jgi:hypothetical protein
VPRPYAPPARRAQVRERARTIPLLRIERAVTRDLPDGRQWPPLGSDWRVVRHLPDAQTLWRRLRLFDTVPT